MLPIFCDCKKNYTVSAAHIVALVFPKITAIKTHQVAILLKKQICIKQECAFFSSSHRKGLKKTKKNKKQVPEVISASSLTVLFQAPGTVWLEGSEGEPSGFKRKSPLHVFTS